MSEGTYHGRGTRDLLKENDHHVDIYSADEQLICSLQIATGKGQTILNTNHRRRRSKSLDALIDELIASFTRPEQAGSYVEAIRDRLPRYTRDHVQCMLKALEGAGREQADQALEFCRMHELYSGGEFTQVLRVQSSQAVMASRPDPTGLVHADVIEKARQVPKTSNLDDYETILNPSATTTSPHILLKTNISNTTASNSSYQPWPSILMMPLHWPNPRDSVTRSWFEVFSTKRFVIASTKPSSGEPGLPPRAGL